MQTRNMKKLITVNEIVSVLGILVLFIAAAVGSASLPIIILATLFIGLCISSSVHSAEAIADYFGPSIGTLILALTVTIIEVALILSMMYAHPETSTTMARDTVFAAIIIVTNGIVGIVILSGGLKFKELSFQTVGTSSLISILAVLSTLTLVLPNFTTSVPGPMYNTGQLIFVSITSLTLYVLMVLAQNSSLKNYFKDIKENKSESAENLSAQTNTKQPLWVTFISLLLSLVAVVGLAKMLTPWIEKGIESINAPQSTVGIVVALLVLAPEAFAALKSARTNNLQTSLNLALGSGVASIALTIPAVSIFSLYSNMPLSLGLDNKGLIFLILTFLCSAFTFGSGRVTALHGLTHLAIMVSYLALTILP